MRARALPVVATALVAVLAGALAGCVEVPDEGPVVEVRAGGDVDTDAGISFDPRPPQPGATRVEIVDEFLTAMRAVPIQTKTAREFLTEDAAASWNPQHETITYSVTPTPRETAAGTSVTLDDAEHIDSRGAWQGTLPRGRRTITFPMTLVDEEWRIDAVPDALIVPETWFQQTYSQVSLYFFDPTATILVPEPVFVPRGRQLASPLTQALLMGPAPGLRRVLQTFVPPGLTVAVGVTVSDDGVADILLTGDASQVTAETIELMLSQFAWTLRQEPSVQSIRISIDGELVPLPGGVSSYRVDGGADYSPAGFQASPLLYGLRAGRVVSGTPPGMEYVDGPLGSRDFGLRSIATDLHASRVAGIGADGTALLVGGIGESEDGRVRTLVSGGNSFLRPAWDVADRIWLVDRAPGGARVSYVQGKRVRPLAIRGITGERVRMFLVSRDGTRLVAVVRRRSGDALMVSRIEHSATGRVVGATRARRIGVREETELPIRGIAWSRPTSVAVLTQVTATQARIDTASVDGSPAGPDVSSATIEGRLLGLAGSPADDEPMYGITRTGVVELVSRRFTPFEERTASLGYVG
jgi:hypothetical protein